jgi:hypothetical protein
MNHTKIDMTGPMKTLHSFANCKLVLRALLGALFLFGLAAVKAVDLERVGDSDSWIFTDVFPYGCIQLPNDFVQEATEAGQYKDAFKIRLIGGLLDKVESTHASYVKSVQSLYQKANQLYPDSPRTERAWVAIAYMAYAHDYNYWLAKNPHYGLQTSLLPNFLDRTDFQGDQDFRSRFARFVPPPDSLIRFERKGEDHRCTDCHCNTRGNRPS